jgi:hypothetical protein
MRVCSWIIAIAALAESLVLNARANEVPTPPNLDDVVMQLELTEAVRDDPTFDFGATYEELSSKDRELWNGPAKDSRNWALNYNAALQRLISGHVAEFHEKLLVLEDIINSAPNSKFAKRVLPARAESLGLLYAWAIEADVDGMEANRFAAMTKRMDLSEGNTSQQFIAAAFAYSTRNTSELQQRANGTGFVAGYAALLMSRLNTSFKNVSRAIELLETELDRAKNAEAQGTGLVALHLAELYRYRYSITRQKSDIDLALERARIARTIELYVST